MKRALVSVSDKTNLVSFVQNLVELGYEIISTGGTKKTFARLGREGFAHDQRGRSGRSDEAEKT